MSTRADLLRPTEHGLYCEAGGFHVDPWRPVERAVVTHGHTDHAHWGCGSYMCATRSEHVLRIRLGTSADIRSIPLGEQVTIGDVRVSFHPAGHVLGSAQVRVEHRGHVWVASGDYKTQHDPTAEAFEPVRCDVFITESTFALPIYRWSDPEATFADINRWWRTNAEEGRTSVISAYALGKAQRIIAGVDASIGPILLHGAITRMMPAYEACGVAMPRTDPANCDEARRMKGRALVITPPGAVNTAWLRRFAPCSTATASGWMRIRGARRRLGNDAGFVLSDHADWPGLLGAIEATGASRVGVTHGYTETLARWLREQGRDAFVIPTRYRGEAGAEDEGESPTTAAEPPAP